MSHTLLVWLLEFSKLSLWNSVSLFVIFLMNSSSTKYSQFIDQSDVGKRSSTYAIVWHHFLLFNRYKEKIIVIKNCKSWETKVISNILEIRKSFNSYSIKMINWSRHLDLWKPIKDLINLLLWFLSFRNRSLILPTYLYTSSRLFTGLNRIRNPLFVKVGYYLGHSRI